MKKQELKFIQMKFAKLKDWELKKVKGGNDDDYEDYRVGADGQP